MPQPSKISKILSNGRGSSLNAVVFILNQDPAVPSPVANWITNSGVTGSPVTSWADSVSSLTLTASGTPTLASSAGTLDWISFDGSDYMEKSDGVGSLPVGNSARTLVYCGYFDEAQWAGFGWGTSSTEQAFSIIANGADDTLKGDLFNDGLITPQEVADGIPFIAFLVHDQNSLTLHLGIWQLETEDITLNTASARINLMRTFSGLDQSGGVGCIRVYDQALDATQRKGVIDELNPLFFAKTTAPVATSVSFTATGATTGTVGATLDFKFSRLYGVVSEAEPTQEQISLGQDSTGAAAPAYTFYSNETDSQVFSEPVTGLTNNTTYSFYYYTEDFLGNMSSVSASASDTTSSTVSAPTSITPASVQTLDTVTGNITQLSADQPVTTWSKQSGDAAINISSVGVVSLSSSLVPATYAFTARATNAGGSYDQSIDLIVTADTQSSADYSTSWGSLRSLLSGWGGTVPLGRDVTVEITGGGTSSDVDISNLSFDYRVRIQPASGTYGMTVDTNGTYTITNPCKVTGEIDLSGSNNIELYRIYVEHDTGNNNSGSINVDSTTDVWTTNCVLSCAPFPFNASSTYSYTPNRHSLNLGRTGQTDGFVARNCLLIYSDAANLAFYNAVNTTIEGCMLEWPRNDYVKMTNSSTTLNLVFSRNWAGGWLSPEEGRHPDWIQPQGGSNEDHLYWGNVNLAQNIEYAYSHGNQSYFFQHEQAGGSGYKRITFSNNMIGGNAAPGIRMWTTGPSTGAIEDIVIEKNEFFHPIVRGDKFTVQDQNPSPGVPYINGELNFSNSSGGNNIQGNDYKQGTNPIWDEVIYPTDIVINTGGESTFNNWAAYDPTAAAYAGMHTGVPQLNLYDFNWARPVTGSQRHWDHASPKGAYERMEEIFDTGIHPGNTGWPLDTPWTLIYNSNGSITSVANVSGRSGVYDSDGNPA